MKIERPQHEIWLQKPGELGIYQQIERAGRVCYKSENNTTNDSAKPFVDRMIQSEHYAMLEHGTVYLVCNHGELPFYTNNKFSRYHTIDGKDYIDGHRIKTGSEFVTPILPITRKILERNNYKMEITSNQKYNQFLKGIGLALNSSFPLTTHIARHTFACTVALGQGISKEVLQIMMGHTSIKTTEIYAKLPIQYVSQNIGDKILKNWK